MASAKYYRNNNGTWSLVLTGFPKALPREKSKVAGQQSLIFKSQEDMVKAITALQNIASGESGSSPAPSTSRAPAKGPRPRNSGSDLPVAKGDQEPTEKQLALLNTLARERSLNRSQIDRIAQEVVGKPSNSLNRREIGKVMDRILGKD